MTGLFDLSDKVALVTGALGLIGKHFCRSLWNSGATVIATDLNGEGCVRFASDFPDRVHGIGMNLLNPEDIKEVAHQIHHRFGPLDVLVNNAALNDRVEEGSGIPCFENYPLNLWNNQWKVNVSGVFLTCQEFGSRMAQNQKGSIINIASTYALCSPDQRLYQQKDGTQTFFKSAAYGATKAAVLSLTQYLACYWAKNNIRVNAISPGGIENNQNVDFISKYSEKTPMGRMGAPQDLNGALIFLASDSSGYVTGHNLVVDGGWTAW